MPSSVFIQISHRPQNPVNYARIAAKQIVKGAEPYGDDVRAAMLKALGQMTHLTREVHKWVGMEYISPGTLARTDQLVSCSRFSFGVNLIFLV